MHRYFVIIWIIGFSFINVFAQDEQSESLKLKLQTATQKEKVSLYLKLSKLSNDYDDKVDYCERAITIANELKDIELQANSNFTLGIYHYSEAKYSDAEKCFQEASIFYRKRNDIKSEAKTYYFLASSNRYRGNFTDAVKYSKMSIALNESIKFSEGVIDAIINSGNIYYASGDMKQAENCFNRVLGKFSKSDGNLAMGQAFLGKGNVLLEKRQADSALYFYEQSQKIFNKLQSKFGQAMTYKDIAR